MTVNEFSVCVRERKKETERKERDKRERKERGGRHGYKHLYSWVSVKKKYLSVNGDLDL